jgi:hypothetical protein
MTTYRHTLYSRNDAITATVGSDRAFIIANERFNKTGKKTFCFNVFKCIEEFLQKRDKFPHCHEILIDHKEAGPNSGGRLVFDFDIEPEDVKTKNGKIPKDFKEQVEGTICYVVTKYFKNVNINKFVYVWSNCPNISKVSKHLTVKNMYFSDFINMTKMFYVFFMKEWDKQYDWISGIDLIDYQVPKKGTQLRMIGSKKIGGNVLEFDDNTHTLTDSLIRIYNPNQLKKEQKITKDNFVESELHKLVQEGEDLNNHTGKVISFTADDGNDTTYNDIKYPKRIYKIACAMIEDLMPGIFDKVINGSFIRLNRKLGHEAKCLMSDHIHENDNAYLCIDDVDYGYIVKFGCYRGKKCNRHVNTCVVGIISRQNHKKTKVAHKIRNGEYDYLESLSDSDSDDNSTSENTGTESSSSEESSNSSNDSSEETVDDKKRLTKNNKALVKQITANKGNWNNRRYGMTVSNSYRASMATNKIRRLK